MKYSKEALCYIDFNDKFEKEGNEEDVCFVCGNGLIARGNSDVK